VFTVWVLTTFEATFFDITRRQTQVAVLTAMALGLFMNAAIGVAFGTARMGLPRSGRRARTATVVVGYGNGCRRHRRLARRPLGVLLAGSPRIVERHTTPKADPIWAARMGANGQYVVLAGLVATAVGCETVVAHPLGAGHSPSGSFSAADRCSMSPHRPGTCT
jgi:hypothetical protein